MNCSSSERAKVSLLNRRSGFCLIKILPVFADISLKDFREFDLIFGKPSPANADNRFLQMLDRTEVDDDVGSVPGIEPGLEVIVMPGSPSVVVQFRQTKSFKKL